MKQCNHCNSYNVKKNGSYVKSDGTLKIRYRCNDCSKTWAMSDSKAYNTNSKFTSNITLFNERYVITSCQNNTPTNWEFVKTLELFCKHNQAELIVIPTYHQEVLFPILEWDINESLLRHEKFSLKDKVNVIANIKINASAENPLGGLDSLSKG